MKAMVIEDVFQLYKRIQNCLFYSFSWSSNFIYRASPVIKQATDADFNFVLGNSWDGTKQHIAL